MSDDVSITHVLHIKKALKISNIFRFKNIFITRCYRMLKQMHVKADIHAIKVNVEHSMRDFLSSISYRHYSDIFSIFFEIKRHSRN